MKEKKWAEGRKRSSEEVRKQSTNSRVQVRRLRKVAVTAARGNGVAGILNSRSLGGEYFFIPTKSNDEVYDEFGERGDENRGADARAERASTS